MNLNDDVLKWISKQYQVYKLTQISLKSSVYLRKISKTTDGILQNMQKVPKVIKLIS